MLESDKPQDLLWREQVTWLSCYKPENRDVFIDEIHRLNSIVEDTFTAMEDYVIDIMIDKGPNARSVQLNIEPFTLVGATTRLGNLTSPLRDGFGVVLRLTHKPEDLFHIIVRSANI